MQRTHHFFPLLRITPIAGALIVSVAHAVDGTWTATTGGNWTDTSKWSGTTLADGSGFTANFTSDITAAASVSLNGTNRIIGNLVFSDNGAAGSAWTITGNTLTLAGGTPTITTTTDAAISSILAGSSGFKKDGAGMLTLSGANTITGNIVVDGGTLRMLRPVGISTSSSFTVNTGGTLDFHTNGSTWAVPAAPISLSGGTLSYTATSGTGQYATGFGAVTVNSASFITVTSAAASGNASSMFLDGGLQGSADLSITSNSNGQGVILRNGNTTYSGKLTVNGNASTTYGTGSGLSIGTFITTPNLSNADLVIHGTVELGFGRAGGMGWGSGGAATGTVQIDALGGTGVVTANFASGSNARTLSVGNNHGSDSFAGQIANGVSGTVSLAKNGTGIQTLSGTNTYTGSTSVNAGTLRFAKTASLYNSTAASWTAANITAASGATLAVNTGGTGEFTSVHVDTLLGNLSTAASATTGLQAGARIGLDTTNASGGSFTQGNAIGNSTGAFGGAIGLTKLGTGTLVLDKTNTYTGATTVSAGTLRVDGSLHASTTVNVAAGATLGGIGTIGGLMTVSGTLAPGASIESITTGSVTMNGGSTLGIAVQDTGATGADLLDVHGDLSLNGTVTLDLTKLGGAGWLNGNKLTLASYTGLWNGGLFTYAGNTIADGGQFSFDSMTWVLDYDDTAEGNNYAGESDGSYVTMTAVPEPTAALIGSFGILCLLRRRR